jgi:hypothetical protein
MQKIEQLQRQATGQRKALFLIAAMALLGVGFAAGHLIGF